MSIQDFMVKLKDLKVRKSDSLIRMPVLTTLGTIDQNCLSHVLEIYITSNYLKSFGYKKLKLTVEKPTVEPPIKHESQEYYDEEEAWGDQD